MCRKLSASKPRTKHQANRETMYGGVSEQTLIPRNARKRILMVLSASQKVALKGIIAHRVQADQQQHLIDHSADPWPCHQTDRRERASEYRPPLHIAAT